MLEKLGRWGMRLAATSPWTNVYGLARSLLAAGTFGTLAFSSADTLFRPALGVPPAPYCEGVSRISMFCFAPPEQLGVARWLAVAILAMVISGWRPQWTALPHWWVAFSLQTSITIPDGGDHINAILTLLLLPVALTDGRKWHWSLPGPFGSPPATAREESRRVVALMALWTIRLQVAIVYFHAVVGKLGVEEWVDGTALYYWLTDPTFGAPSWITPVLEPVLTTPLTLALLTWGTLVLELLLAVGLLLPERARQRVLLAGIAFHSAIAITMGLVSFGLAMFGALILYLRPVDQPLHLPNIAGVARRAFASLVPARAAQSEKNAFRRNGLKL